MTRRGATPGFRPQHAGGNGPPVNRENRVREVLRAKATRRILREPDAALLLEVLGLADDPLATLRRTNRRRDVTRTRLAEAMPTPGLCPLCRNPMPKTGICRKRIVCREAAARKEMET